MDKYEKALEQARNYYPDNQFLDTIFPELAESEDERIRKELIEQVAYILPDKEEYDDEGRVLPAYHKRIERYRAYLEKQKEQKPERINITEMVAKYAATDEYVEGEYKGKPVNCMIRAYEQGIRDTLLKVKEQKPTEWSEEYRKEDLRTRFAFYTYNNEPDNLYLSNVFVEKTIRNIGIGTMILRAAESVADTMGAHKIRLKAKQESLANEWYRKRGYYCIASEDGYDWLEKYLEYMKPSKPAEWSKEDEKVISDSCYWLAEYAGYLRDKNCGRASMLMGLSEKLKSLRPQPHWKPSDIQMAALKYATTYVPDDEGTLASLFRDLENLK